MQATWRTEGPAQGFCQKNLGWGGLQAKRLGFSAWVACSSGKKRATEQYHHPYLFPSDKASDRHVHFQICIYKLLVLSDLGNA